MNYFNKKLPAPLNKRNTAFCLYGRNALYLGLKRAIIKDKNEKHVLVPVYTCGEEVQSIIAAGLGVIPYKISPHSLQIRLVDLKKKITKETAGILIIHYFGFPQEDISIIRDICNAKNILLIEDCAHCIRSFINGVPLGSFGDMAIFSLRKFLPIPHGGALIINNPRRFKEIPKFKPPTSQAVFFDKDVFKKISGGYFKPSLTIRNIYEYLGEKMTDFGPRLSRFGGYMLGISTYAKNQISKVDIKELTQSRNKIYRKCIEFFKNNETSRIKPLFQTLNQHVTPLFFPVVTNVKTNKIKDKLGSFGVDFIRPFWEHTHPAIDLKYFPEIKKLKAHLLIIPLERKTLEKKALDILVKANR